MRNAARIGSKRLNIGAATLSIKTLSLTIVSMRKAPRIGSIAL
jgi:hypothetical protein